MSLHKEVHFIFRMEFLIYFLNASDPDRGLFVNLCLVGATLFCNRRKQKDHSKKFIKITKRGSPAAIC